LTFHVTAFLILLLPRVHAALGGERGVRRVLIVLVLLSTLLRYHLVHSLTLGASCPWHAYIRGLSPEPFYSPQAMAGSYADTYGHFALDVPLTSMPDMPRPPTRLTSLRRSLAIAFSFSSRHQRSPLDAPPECTATIFGLVSELSARAYNPSYARAAPFFIGGIAAVNHLTAIDQTDAAIERPASPHWAAAFTLLTLLVRVLCLAMLLLCIQFLRITLTSPLDYSTLHYAPDATISFVQTFWPLLTSISTAILFYSAIAPPTSPWSNPITRGVLSLGGPFRFVGEQSAWIIVLHCPILLLLTIHRVVPRLAPSLAPPSLLSVLAHYVLVLALTLPLARLCTAKLEPKWRRVSDWLLGVALGEKQGERKRA